MPEVTADFHYLEWQDIYKVEKPFQILIEIPKNASDQRTTNLKFSEGFQERVHDVRGHGDDFQLDKHGFTFLKAPSELQPEDFSAKKIVSDKYLKECEDVLKKHVDGVDQAHIYNWLVRDSDESLRDGRTIDLNNPLAKLGPGKVVHIDQNPEAVVQRVLRELPLEAEKLLRGRIRLFNLWRPINGPVETWPLALCDGRTISPSTLVESQRVRRTYTGGTTWVLHEPDRKWYYLSGQRNDEVALFKCFDSDGTATKYAAHSAFLPPGTDPDAKPRHSIEVRAMVFTWPR